MLGAISDDGDEPVDSDCDSGTWDCIVVGAGPAGLNAALVLGRARRRVLVLDSAQPRNYATHEMHGVLGHDGLDPADLRARGRAELGRYGVEVVTAEVQDAEALAGTVRVTSSVGGTSRGPCSSPRASSTRCPTFRASPRSGGPRRTPAVLRRLPRGRRPSAVDVAAAYGSIPADR